MRRGPLAQRLRRSGTLLCLVTLALLAGPRLALAHATPESRVWLDTTPQGWRLTLLLPLNRLDYAFRTDLSAAPAQVLSRHGPALADYLLAHVSVHSGAQRWRAQRPHLTVIGDNASADLQAVIELQAPPGADPRQAVLDCDAVTHEVMTHRIKVFLRSDWAGGQVAQLPRPLGELDTLQRQLPLSLPLATGPWGGLRQLVADGTWHILEGSDHLMFLLTLLLVSPLQAEAGRWARVRRAGPALRHTAGVVTAFTVGHSVALVLGSSGWVQLPSAVVELAVAATIAVSALHAWRPLCQRGDIAMALAFGLVHGLAFSASLNGAGLSWQQHALALLAFNLGIEAVQLALVALLLPLLWWVQQRFERQGAWLRQGLAVLAGLAALVWLQERLPAIL